MLQVLTARVLADERERAIQRQLRDRGQRRSLAAAMAEPTAATDTAVGDRVAGVIGQPADACPPAPATMS